MSILKKKQGGNIVRLKLRVTHFHEEEIIRELREKDIEICEDSTLVLYEEIAEDRILCKKEDETIIVPLEDIIYIESLGHNVFLHLDKDQYKVSKRLYQLESELPENQFIRISNSIIIARNAIKKIKPALSCKFILTLKNGDRVDVTRTYYYKFKEYFKI